ncbi:EamA family transporter [Thermoflexus sp.]|uniref:EamA family transporter n=1 Tax=Thermoflexus sp. TaxID=1969742 RepID=UPI003A0FB8DE
MAAVLLYTAPAWVAFLSWIFLREPMGAHKLAALLLTLLGVDNSSRGQPAGRGGADPSRRDRVGPGLLIYYAGLRRLETTRAAVVATMVTFADRSSARPPWCPGPPDHEAVPRGSGKDPPGAR